MIDIKDTSSVFQLAFGLNAVIMIIFKNSYQKRKEFLDHIGSEIKKHVRTSNIENQFLLSSYPTYKKIKYIFFFFIVLSIFSILCSFYYLVAAVLEPTLKMSEDLFLTLSVFLILINPILYYFYEVMLDLLISLIKDKSKITKDTAIQMSKVMNMISKNREFNNEISEKLQKTNKLIFESKIKSFQYKLKTNPFLHPLKWYKKREMKRYVNMILEEENIKKSELNN